MPDKNKFDEILIRYVGEFGLYQKLQLILICSATMFTAMHSLSWTFTGASIPYRCLLGGENETFPFIPINDNYSHWLYGGESRNKIKHACQRIKNVTISISKYSTENDVSYEPCNDGYIWDTSEITNSAFKKWKMVCDNQWLRSFIQSMYNVGQFFGSFVFGVLADKYGRKKIFFIAIMMQIICGLIMAYIPYWPLFALFRILVGFFHPGIFIIAVVMVIEMVGPDRRLLSSTSAGIFFAIGVIVLGLFAYGIRDYQNLQLAISLPPLLYIALWRLIPESARWLVSQNRFEEASKILNKTAQINKQKLPQDWHSDLPKAQQKLDADVRRFSYKDLFRTQNIRKRTLICCILWPAVSMTYYGLAMNPSFLGGDRYLAFILGGLLDIVAILIVLFTMNIVGRKILCSVGFLFATFCLFVTLAVPAELETLRMVLVIVGKMSLTGVYSLVFVITPELYPTIIRTTAVGFCSMIARVGAISAPYITLWLADISPVAVLSIFGCFCTFAGILTIFLPETAGQLQLETLDEAEKFGHDQPLFFCVWRKSKL